MAGHAQRPSDRGRHGNDDVGRSILLARIERRLAVQPLLEEGCDAIRGAGIGVFVRNDGGSP